MKAFSLLQGLGLSLILLTTEAVAGVATEIPYLQPQVDARQLPPMQQRLPEVPAMPSFADRETGQYGGRLRMLMSKAKDIRQMVVFGYARLVGYDAHLQLRADILQGIEVEDNRVFTLQLRPGMRWSDGHPFTAEDFRFYWEDIASNATLSPFGPPKAMLAQGEAPALRCLTAIGYALAGPIRTPISCPRWPGHGLCSSICRRTI